MRLWCFQVVGSVFLAGSFLGCTEAKFFGYTDSVGADSALPKDFPGHALTVPCESNDDNPKPWPKDATGEVGFQGEICPQGGGKLTVLFVIDVSGSMGRHVVPGTSTEHRGNDPMAESGRCGRLEAAEAIVRRLQDTTAQGTSATVGYLPFAGRPVGSWALEPEATAAFEDKVTSRRFCSYVVPDSRFGYHPQNPGGRRVQEAGSSTNYAAAFRTAFSWLRQRSGRKVIYFISDGEPTSGGSDPVLAGIEAGQSLMNGVDNLTVNSLFLGARSDGARDVMARVAGSQKRLRTVDRADELAEEILRFPPPKLQPGWSEARLELPEGAAIDFPVASMQAPESAGGPWSFATESVDVTGRLPGRGRLKFVLEAVSEAGGTHTVFRAFTR